MAMALLSNMTSPERRTGVSRPAAVNQDGHSFGRCDTTNRVALRKSLKRRSFAASVGVQTGTSVLSNNCSAVYPGQALASVV